MTIRVLNTTASVTANSNVLILSTPTDNIQIGDVIINASFSSNVFVQSIKSNVKLIASNVFPSTIVSGSFGFARDIDNSKFNKFLNAYYTFLEETGNPQEILQNIKEYGDIDYTIDSLVENFFVNYASNLPRNLETDKRSFIKRVRDLYKSNGTEDAFKILFRAMFNEEIEIFYPESKVLKASDGQWVKDNIIKVQANDGYDPFYLENTKIIGNTSQAYATVSKVIKENIKNTQVYNLFLDTNSIDGIFDKNEIITGRKLITTSNIITINAIIIPSIINVDVINQGIGYTTNNIITISSISGVNAKAKVKSVTKRGQIKAIEISDNGAFYDSNTTITIDSPAKILAGTVVVQTGTSSNIGTFTSASTFAIEIGEIINGYYITYLGRYADQGGLDYWTSLVVFNLATLADIENAIRNSPEASSFASGIVPEFGEKLTTTVGSNSATGAEHGLLKNNTANITLQSGSNLSIKVSTIINTQEFRFLTSYPTGVYTGNLVYDNSANLIANIGALRISEGYWKNSRGKLSEKIFVRGSSSDLYQYPIYYQPYSYVVRTNVSKNEWEDIVKKTAHPAGTELFGEVFIVSEDKANVNQVIDSEIWNYLAITTDKDTVTVDKTAFGSNTIIGFQITSDHTYMIFDYL